MGSAILTFYASLVDLLGRCAPDAESIKAGRSDALRARSILRSLVSMEDLEGVLGLRFILPVATGDGDDGGKKSLYMKVFHEPGISFFENSVVSDQLTSTEAS